MLTTDHTAALAELRAQYDPAAARLEETRAALRADEGEAKDLNRKLNSGEREVKALQASRERMRKKVPQLEASKPEVPRATALIEALEWQRDAEEAVATAETQVGADEDVLQQAAKEHSAALDTFNELDKRRKELDAVCHKTGNALAACNRNIGEIDHRKRELDYKLSSATKKLSSEQSDMLSKRAKLDEKMAKTIEEGYPRPEERIENTTKDALERAKLNAKEAVRFAESQIAQQLSRHEVITEYLRAERQLRQTIKELDYEEEICEQSQQLKLSHKQTLRRVRKTTSQVMAQCFGNTVDFWEMDGCLIIMHDDRDDDNNSRTLEMKVFPRGDGIKKSVEEILDAEGGSVSALSGGERSKANVGFITSLWDTTDMPLRMLDEFDVFMDDAGREMAVQMLVHAARKQNRQFVFLTPLSLPIRRLRAICPEVEPYRMPDPVRAANAD